MFNKKRLVIALICGALLGIICVLGVGIRLGFGGNGLFISGHLVQPDNYGACNWLGRRNGCHKRKFQSFTARTSSGLNSQFRIIFKHGVCAIP